MGEGHHGEPALRLDQSAELLGGYCLIERRLFQLSGAWSIQAEDERARLHLDEVSLQHAWHADLWLHRLPVLDGWDPESFISRAEMELGGILDALEDFAEADGGELKVFAGLYRFLVPRLLASYGLHLDRANPSADAPVIRALRLVMRDDVESWQHGESILQSLIKGPKEAEISAGVLRDLEEKQAARAPGVGLVRWPGRTP